MRRLFQAMVARLRRGRAAAPPVAAPTTKATRTPGGMAETRGSSTATKPGRGKPGGAKPVGTRPPANIGAKAGSTDQVPTGRHLAYAPQLDGRADPGEIVWTYVPYEDDPHQGKDRPVLVVGRQGTVLLGLMLSSNDDRDGQHNWFALGSGGWDRTERPSWVRLDRVLRVAEDGIRREGAVLDRRRFDAVAARLRKGYGWR